MITAEEVPKDIVNTMDHFAIDRQLKHRADLVTLSTAVLFLINLKRYRKLFDLIHHRLISRMTELKSAIKKVQTNECYLVVMLC